MAVADPTHPPSTTTAAITTAMGDDSTRGRPYYEKLRRDLKQILDKKRDLDRTMSTLENSIARLESSYLEETSAAGNIIKGFDNYIKASSGASSANASANTGTATRRKGGVSEQDRIFSRSSVSWSTRDSPAPLVISNLNRSTNSSGAATPIHSQSGAASARDTPTSTNGGNSKNGGKNNKKRSGGGGGAGKDKTKEEADEDGERPAKRGKVSWGRD